MYTGITQKNFLKKTCNHHNTASGCDKAAAGYQDFLKTVSKNRKTAKLAVPDQEIFQIFTIKQAIEERIYPGRRWLN